VDHTEKKFQFTLEVTGEDGKNYVLQVIDRDDRPSLVVDALQAIAKVWPSFAFKFKVTGQEIVDFL
jgi:hypothetical protein